jgi:hypothetical protein
VEVEKLADPPERPLWPSWVEPSKKVTEPVGVGPGEVPAQGVGDTVTESVTACPKPDGFGELLNVAVAELLTVCAKALEEPPKPGSGLYRACI